MKKLLPIVFTLFTISLFSYSIFPVSCTYASPAPKEIISEGIYQAGDSDTPAAAKEAALLDAKRKALEQCGTLVTSATTIQNYIVKDDTVRSLAAGVMEVTVLDEHRTSVGDGTQFYVKIRALVYPEQLKSAINSLQNGGTPAPIPVHHKRVYTDSPDTGNATMNQLLLNSIKKNDIDMVKSAVENGASVNIYENSEQCDTALTLAISKDNIMSYLISMNADVNAQVNVRGCPGANETPLIKAVEQNNIFAVKTLVENGAAINYHDARGMRALDAAVSRGASQIVKYLLLSPGIDVNYNIIFLDNPTVLQLAIKKGNVQTIQALLDAGADRNATDKVGKTARDYAIDTSNTEIMHLFL